MRRALLGVLACLLAVGAFLGVQLACVTRTLPFDPATCGPNQFDSAVYSIPETEFETWEWALYSPDEIDAAEASGTVLPQGEAPEEWADEQPDGSVSQWYGTGFARFRTDCLVLHLTPGGRYGIHVENATYAMRLWVDGDLLAENGTVVDNADDFVPQTRSNTVFFTAGEDGTASIVLQRANFNHRYWNTAVLKVGAADLVQDMAARQLFGVVTTLATLLALALVNMAMGLLARERSAFLLLAAACLLIAVKGSLDDPKPLMLLVPDLDWALSHRLEHCSFMVACCCLALFWWRSLSPVVPRWAAVATVAITAAGIASHLAVPAIVYSGFGGIVIGVAMAWLVAFVAVSTWHALRNRRSMGAYRWATWAAMIFFAACEAVDALGFGGMESVSVSDVGVACVALMHTVALALAYRETADELDAAQARETADELDAAQAREAELARMNESLAALGRVRETYLQNLVHELRTPLSVIAGYSGLTRMQLE